MTPTIREKVLHCCRLFNSASTKSGELKDVSQHFVSWYSNIAAHRAGPASLDERLRDAPDVRAAILRFLGILINMFDNYKYANARHDIDFSSRKYKPLDILVHKAASSKPITLMYKVIDCLKRITTAIRTPASVDRYKKAQNVGIGDYCRYDESHILELFPNANPILRNRLLQAVLSRRRFLQYTKDHRDKLGHKTSSQNSQDVSEGIDAEGKSEFADTVATPMSPETSLEDSSPMGLSYNDDEEVRSVYSNSSSLRSDTMARIPSMPLEGQSGKPFECPCCFLMIEVKNREQWKRHVIADMRPYVCTFADCKVPDLLFSSRHGWESFDSHVKAVHVNHLGTADAETHGAYSRQLPEHQVTSCPLCGKKIRQPEKAKTHIGHHQAQLGLWPLRSMREFEDDDNQDEGEETDNELDVSEEEKKEEKRDGEEVGKEKKDSIITPENYPPMRLSGEIKRPEEDPEDGELSDLELNESDTEPSSNRELKSESLHNKPSMVSAQFDDANSRLSIPGDEMLSVEDWEDRNPSLEASTQKPRAISKPSISNQNNTFPSERLLSTFDLPGTKNSENLEDNRIDDRGMSSVISEPYDGGKKPRNGETDPAPNVAIKHTSSWQRRGLRKKKTGSLPTS